MRIDRTGCTRIVLLTKNYVFKLPNFLEGYRSLLTGLLANHQEIIFSKAKLDGFCPVVFSIPFGLLVVMPRVRLLSDEEFLKFDYHSFRDRNRYIIPSENKANSFGWYNGKIVSIDYGN